MRATEGSGVRRDLRKRGADRREEVWRGDKCEEMRGDEKAKRGEER